MSHKSLLLPSLCLVSIALYSGLISANPSQLIGLAAKGDDTGLRSQIESGVDINTIVSGTTALQMAAQEARLGIVEILIEQGADLELKRIPNGETALFIAAEKGHSDIVTRLLAAGANPETGNKNGATPLFIAAQNDQLNTVKILLEAKVDCH